MTEGATSLSKKFDISPSQGETAYQKMKLKKLSAGILIAEILISVPVYASQKKIKNITATRGSNPIVKIEYQDGSILISNFLVPQYEDEEIQTQAQQVQQNSQLQTQIQNQAQPQNQNLNQNSNSVSDLAKNIDLDLNEISGGSSGRYKQILAANMLVEDARRENPNQIVVTPAGEKYHYAKCEDLRVHCKPVTIAEAKSLGYTACSKCNPPEN